MARQDFLYGHLGLGGGGGLLVWLSAVPIHPCSDPPPAVGWRMCVFKPLPSESTR